MGAGAFRGDRWRAVRGWEWTAGAGQDDETRYRLHIEPVLGELERNKITALDLERVLDGMRAKETRLGGPFAPATGRRRQEILALRWADVEFDRKQVKILATTIKVRKTQHFSLNEMALAVLKEAKAIQVSELCFPASAGKHYHSFDKTWGGYQKEGRSS